MKVHEINGITWHLSDDGLLPVVREISGREETRRGYTTQPYGSGQVFIKYFREKGIPGFVRNRVQPRGKKEYDTGLTLLSFPIPTPKPLAYGISPTGSYVIQEWLDGIPFSQMFKEGDKADLLMGLARLLRSLKDHHVRHNDLHLDNILVFHGDPFLIDLHKMKIKKIFAARDEASNLSHALVSLYNDLDEDEKVAFFLEYGSMSIRNKVETEIGRLISRWFTKKKKRAFEGTSKITVTGDRLYVTGMEGRALGDFVETIKNDKKVRVERYTDHIRKIYRDKRRLKKAWKAHVIFLYMNLPTVPEPYYCSLPSSGKPGYIAMEDLKGKGEELDRYLDRHYDTMTYGERKRFIDGLARFFDPLFKWGIVHNDMKGCNLFVVGGRKFILLDVEDFAFSSLHTESLKTIFLQLNTTLPKRIVMRDRIRFFIRLTAFLSLDRKALFRVLLWKSAGKEIVYEGKSGLMRESW